MDMYSTEHLYDRLQVLEQKESPLDRKERLRAMEKPLLAWYGSRARSLPWRDDPKPYRVWISEIMLQQTRVEAVKPYFERFMKAFPSVQALAEAEDDYLMKMWEGLGYYNRARNLKAAARMVMEEYGGCLPASFEELIRLPGIGSYTAGAIASIAFNMPLPAVDGNVLRVISRVLGDREDIKKASVKARMEQELKAVMPKSDASRYNQGLIEIGALVCIPGGEPRCGECPLASVCLTRQNGWWKEIPYKSPNKARKIEERTVFIIECHDKVAIRKRAKGGLLAELYELPNVEGHPGEDEMPTLLGLKPEWVKCIMPLPTAKHVFSHVEWHMTGYRVEVEMPEMAGNVAADGTIDGGIIDGGITGGGIIDGGVIDSGQNASGATGWFFTTREKLASTYALPNAFQAYTSLIG